MHAVQGSSMALPNAASLQSCDLWMVTSPVRSLSKALITKTLFTFTESPQGPPGSVSVDLRARRTEGSGFHL